jgi:phage-related minor tail protein
VATDSLGQLTVDMVANTGGFERGMDRVERALKSTTREAKFQGQQLDKLIGQIDPVVAAYSRLDKMEEQLRKHRQANRLDEADFQGYLKSINEQRAAVEKTSSSFAGGAISAKQFAAATRGLPAQFTDIAVSLQAGQNPLTVFLQQGGQLKDMFGGLGPATKALGGYVLGLINPFTVAAAAAAALALAYKQGSDESTAYNKAIILSGNASGVSAGQLATMAEQIDEVAGTQRNAASALAQFAESGKFTANQLKEVTQAAIQFEVATGQAIDKTVEQFKKLADDPAKASAELNKQYNYLTASIYAQITALQQQGDAAGAADLAIDAFAKTMADRAQKIEDNLGLIERVWKGIKEGAAEAWDEMLGIGRDKTLEQQLSELEKGRSMFSAKTAAGFASGGLIGGVGAQLFGSFSGPSVDDERERLKLAIQQRDQSAAKEAATAKSNRDAIDAQLKIDELTKSALTNEQKRTKEIAEYRKNLEKIRAINPQDTRLDQAEIDKNIANINDKYKDQKAPKQKAFREDSGQKLLDDLRQQYAVIQAQNDALGEQDKSAQKIGENAKALIKWESELATLKETKTLTAEQKSLLASSDLLTAQYKRNAVLEEELEHRKEIIDVTKDYQKLTDVLDANGKSQLKTARAQLEVLERAKKAGIVNPEDYAKQQAQIAGVLTTKAPKFSGLDASIGGAGGELDKIADAKKELETWYSEQLEILAKFREEKSELTAVADQEELELKKQHEEKLMGLEKARVRGTLAASEEFFGNMAALSQSGNKKLGQIGKAAAIAQATISGVQAVMNALAVPPYPVGLALSISAGVLAAANVAQIAGVGFKTGGYTGSGGVNDVAGVVHGREFVFDAASTARIGVANLKAMQTGGMDSVAARIDAPARNVNTNINISLPGMTRASEARESAPALKRAVSRGIADAMRYS